MSQKERVQRLQMEAREVYDEIATIEKLQRCVDWHLDRGEGHRAGMVLEEAKIRFDVLKARVLSLEDRI